ncbi:hypothetical protein F4802DRAFT_226716 [Xylaria palmicola]|nr:hypothetical protein F4802DRAFT_226716 [Xylaria palmicola]
MMASLPERAHTCRLSSSDDTSFLRFSFPDWSKIDIIGQTILLAQLTPHFGSFQNVCAALKLQSNEVESFLLAHIEYANAAERGRLVAEEWGRVRAVPADDSEDIPQQRPVLICLSSIAPACDFLESMGYQELVPAVKAWSRRTITWPPHIDVTNLDLSQLDQSEVNFPIPLEQRAYSTYVSALGDDSRAMVALVGAWKPKEDRTPDTRISFINVKVDSVAYGPRGARQLFEAGRYYVCWPIGDPPDGQYNDFVLARNALENHEDGSSRHHPTAPEHIQDNNAITEFSSIYRDSNTGPEALNVKSGSQLPNSTQRTDLSVNPKDIFGSAIPDAHSLSDQNKSPFQKQDAPQGPARRLANPRLRQIWNEWPGQIFQFRLPSGYTIMGPLGNILTFDPPQHERYDEMGNPQGVGGTYFVVPSQKSPNMMSFKIDELPANVALRLKVPENLVIIRNGMVLPGFVERGVHEWSTREGFLDFYNEHGCYDIFRRESQHNIFPDTIRSSFRQQVGLGNDNQNVGTHRGEGDGMVHGQQVVGVPSPAEEALEILAPHREWLNRMEAETMRLEREMEVHAQRGVKSARDKVWREAVQEARREEQISRKKKSEMREAEERARADSILRIDTSIAEDVRNRRSRRIQSSDSQPDSSPTNMEHSDDEHRDGQRQQLTESPIDVDSNNKTTPRPSRAAGGTRPTRPDSDDEDYTPTRRQTPKARQRKSAQGASTLRSIPVGSSTDARGARSSRSTPVPKSRQKRAAPPQAQAPGDEAGCASTGMRQSSGAPRITNLPRAASIRKPIGPLLDAIQANSFGGDGGNMRLNLAAVPVVNEQETPTSTIQGSGRNKRDPRGWGARAARAAREPARRDTGEAEREVEH